MVSLLLPDVEHGHAMRRIAVTCGSDVDQAGLCVGGVPRPARLLPGETGRPCARVRRPRSPQDIFSGGALHYKPQADGYLLYSVGPNGIDDGGRNEMTTPTTTSFRAATTSPSASCRNQK